MINIVQNESIKCPDKLSLFISFDFNREIIDIIKTCDCWIFDKKTKCWEVPISEKEKLIKKLVSFDKIDFNIIKDENDIIKQDNYLEYELKNNFKTTPFDYQLDGIKYGLTHDRWLLLDAPGLGKTLQIIYIAEKLKEQGKIKHCLIICGVNTLKTNWKKEIQIHSKETCKILGERVTKTGKTVFGGIKDRLNDLDNFIEEFFIITNIESLRNSDIIKSIQKGKNDIDMIVLDEAHCCKNPTATQTKNFLKLKNAKYKIAATGTLLTNSPLDAYVPLKWINEIKCNYTNFKYYFVKYGGYFNHDIIGYRHIDVLKNILSVCSLRRTKDLLNLPPKIIIDEIVDMNDEQQKFYNDIVNGIVNNIDKVNMSNNSILSNLIRLRQATACPSILTSENISSSKIDRCKDLVEQIISNNEKVVVFSTFKETLNVLKDKLNIKNTLICTGDISDAEISNNIDKFQTNSNYKIMLATWSKMGTGITLTASSNVIFIDTPYTNAGVQQAIDRCYRIGTKKSLIVYFLYCKDTVDEKIRDIVIDKELISDYVIDDKINDLLIERLRSIILNLN